MPSFEQILFLIQFFIMLAILLAQLYLILEHKRIIPTLTNTFLIGAGLILIYGIGIITFMINRETLTLQLFRLETAIFLLNMALLFITGFIIAAASAQKVIGPYKSNENRI